MKKPLLLGIILTVCVVIGTFVFSLGYPGGMVSYWKFDEGAESTVSDSVDANHGTIYGAQWTTDGMINGALSFDGSDDYVEVPTSANLDITDAITLEAWVNPQTVGAWKRVIVKGEDITPSDLSTWAYILGLSQGGGVYFALFAGNSQTYINGAVTKIPTNTWTHIAGTWDGVMMRIYVNGIEQSEKLSFSGPINVVTHPLKFGIAPHSGAPFAFNGKIDEAAIYNRALSAGEIQQHYEDVSYEVECVTPPSGMVSWWDGDGNADDIAGGNNGTLEGGATFDAGKVGDAFSFDGTNDYVEIPDSESLDTGMQFTVDAWFNTDDVDKTDPGTKTKTQTIVMYGWDPADGKNNPLHIRDGKLYVAIRGYGNGFDDLVGVTSVNSNTWYHAAVTNNGTTAKLYLNGELEASKPSLMNMNTNSRVTIGRYQNPSNFNTYFHFDGLIDEVEIFNRALTASEIQDIYLAGSAGKCKEEVVVEVTIDIKPGSDPNSINLGDHGLLPVAILGTPEFDVTTIDPYSIEIGGVSLTLRGPAKKVQKLAYSYEDVDEDGNIDMMVFFDVQALVLDGVLDENAFALELTATLDDDTPIKGTDSVRVLH